MTEITIHNGDNRLILKEFSDASFDSCVTDPPYELGFMGKSWDKSGIAYDVAMWKEVYRVLKPGAHLLAFGGSRTYHRLACAIEDAGFEIRDQIQWLYGSGFPKSLDISKQMDKPGKIGIWNDEFDKVRAWLREKVRAKGLKHKEIDRAIGNENSHMASHFLGISQPMLPTWDQWVIIKKLLDIDEDLEIVPKCIGYAAESARTFKFKDGEEYLWSTAQAFCRSQDSEGYCSNPRFSQTRETDPRYQVAYLGRPAGRLELLPGTLSDHGLAQVCRSTACQKRRKAENEKRSNDKRRALGLRRESEYHQKPTNGKVERVCECGRRFATVKTWDGLPRFTRCLECRQEWETLECGALF